MASRWAQCESIVMVMMHLCITSCIFFEATQPGFKPSTRLAIINNDDASACSIVSPRILCCSCRYTVMVQIEGAENLPPPNQPAVYVSNHQSFLVQSACISLVVLCWSCACVILMPVYSISLGQKPKQLVCKFAHGVCSFASTCLAMCLLVRWLPVG